MATPGEREGAAAVAVRDLLACVDPAVETDRGEDRDTVNRAAAGGGEAWLRDCAYGQGPSGTGNAAVWLRVGNVQHMSYVVRSLRA
ncbi:MULTISPECIES: hypothetical protein [unclassified Streptomyces]|uniref:hypothetical protein n=1 Tax=unclassified Streptomyces TaxID=2593676 RepID=UPI003717CDF4